MYSLPEFGYARAASQLASQGYYEEAKNFNVGEG